MYKLLGLLKRPAGHDFGDFKKWWLQEHAPRVVHWPGLTAYRINLSVEPDMTFDGMAEVWFESLDAMQQIFETPEGQAARAGATGASGEIVILTSEEHVIVEGGRHGGMFKALGILKRPDDVTQERFRKWWLEEHAPLIKPWPGMVNYRVNLCLDGDQRFDGVAEVWFDTREAMEHVFTTPQAKRARNHTEAGSKERVVILTEEHIIVE